MKKYIFQTMIFICTFIIATLTSYAQFPLSRQIQHFKNVRPMKKRMINITNFSEYRNGNGNGNGSGSGNYKNSNDRMRFFLTKSLTTIMLISAVKNILPIQSQCEKNDDHELGNNLFKSNIKIMNEENCNKLKGQEDKLISMLEIWKEYADKLFKQSLSIDDEYSKQYLNFRNSYALISNIIVEIKTTFIDNKNLTLICDQSGNLQSIAIHQTDYESKNTKIKFLATSPFNFVHSLNKQAVSGAGKAALNAIIRKNKSEGKFGTITTHATKNSVGFYQKMGFRMMNERDNLMILNLR
jgi:hypothetical protein